MVKKSGKKGEVSTRKSTTDAQAVEPFLVEQEAVDPSLALLFASSAGPVKPPSTIRYDDPPPPLKHRPEPADVERGPDVGNEFPDEDGEDLSSLGSGAEDETGVSAEEDDSLPNSLESMEPTADIPQRKRKRQTNEDDLEGKYMLRLAKEEEKEEETRQVERRLKRQRLMAEQDPDMSEEEEDLNDYSESIISDDSDATKSKLRPVDIPQHETLVPDKEASELEKSSRTVFLANVSTTAITEKKAKKSLLEHMASFLDSLPVQEGKKAHKVESIRFRSTAYAGTSLPRKAAFATKNLMGATTKSTNAYIVYSTAFAAREAVKRLNGTVVLDRHLRVDGVAHPAKTDHRRCVFVGNLGFVDDETMLDQGENERKRSKIPSDVEEGLWRQFSKAGTVESVRVVRDEKTRVGKGFAYVQFEDANSVETALLFHEKKYPPMLPRVLRVTRAKAVKKTTLASRPPGRAQSNGSGNPNHERIYNPKTSGQEQSLQGRAGKLLGRAGAARFKKADIVRDQHSQPSKGITGISKTPQNIVFEGYRASQKSGKPKDLKLGGSGGGKKKGKPRTRSSKRATEWKKGKGKPAR